MVTIYNKIGSPVGYNVFAAEYALSWFNKQSELMMPALLPHVSNPTTLTRNRNARGLLKRSLGFERGIPVDNSHPVVSCVNDILVVDLNLSRVRIRAVPDTSSVDAIIHVVPCRNTMVWWPSLPKLAWNPISAPSKRTVLCKGALGGC